MAWYHTFFLSFYQQGQNKIDFDQNETCYKFVLPTAGISCDGLLGLSKLKPGSTSDLLSFLIWSVKLVEMIFIVSK